jgi:Lipoxygenase
MKIVIIFITIPLLISAAYFFYQKYIKKERSILHLPLQELGFKNVPAYPIVLTAVVETLVNLLARSKEVTQAKWGLTTNYTIKNYSASAYAFAFGKGDSNTKEESVQDLLNEVRKSTELLYKNTAFVNNKLKNEGVPYKELGAEKLTTLSLDHPSQFSLSWTTFGNLHRNATTNLLTEWSRTLTDASEATEQFFPIIAKYGAAYNLLILQKVMPTNFQSYKDDFLSQWTAEMDALYNDGTLYIIDLRIYKMLQPQQAEGFDRFTPATFTWLKQNKETKAIEPFAVHVSGYNGNNAQFYEYNIATDAAWLYALQAAKTSITVYGIWLGHVYHWHLVTASMVMTMFNTISADHAINQILAPQSKYIIGFNDVLVLLWKKAAPPTSIKTAYQFLELVDTFASGRNFFDDDPTRTIEMLGLVEADFTDVEPWDKYPIIGYLLRIWGIVQEYATTFVENTYNNDEKVLKDKELQEWISISQSSDGGNIKGLPVMDTKVSLIKVLTSILYRITAHGISRLDNTANPAMTFVGNYPACLQSTHIPDPSSSFDTNELMAYLPNTGTIGEMITFYYTFVDSAPYEPIIPITGVDEELFFKGGKESSNNKALVHFRHELTNFMENYTESNKIPNMAADSPQFHQWPRSIET